MYELVSAYKNKARITIQETKRDDTASNRHTEAVGPSYHWYLSITLHGVTAQDHHLNRLTNYMRNTEVYIKIIRKHALGWTNKGFHNRLRTSQMRGTVKEFLKGGRNLRKGSAEMCASVVEHVTFKDMYPPGGSMSSVRRDAAVGTITLQWTLYFLPSIARVLFRPTSPILAALQPKHPDKNTLQQPHTTTITHQHVLSHTTKQCFLPSTGEGSSESKSKKILKALKVCSLYHASICKMK